MLNSFKEFYKNLDKKLSMMEKIMKIFRDSFLQMIADNLSPLNQYVLIMVG